MKKLIGGIVAILIAAGALTACSDADTVSQNLSTDADNYKLYPRNVSPDYFKVVLKPESIIPDFEVR